MSRANINSSRCFAPARGITSIWLILATAALAGALTGSAGGAVGFPPFPGTYQATVTGKAPSLNGTWRIIITRAGHYDMYKGTTKLVSGTAKAVGAASRQRVLFTDTSGPGACRGSRASGLYHWEFGYVYLDLTALRDTCTARRAILVPRLKLEKSP